MPLYELEHQRQTLTADPIEYSQETKPPMDQPTYAVQPAAWGNFDGYGCDYAVSIAHAYKIAGIWRSMNERHGQGEDMMIFKILPGGNPIAWVRVYADESVDAVTDEALALL